LRPLFAPSNALNLSIIKSAVVSLPVDEYRQFRDWFLERDWAQWDKQIQADSESGKLDFLVKEAMDEKSRGKLRDLRFIGPRGVFGSNTGLYRRR
jgi:hypothetical protein